MCNKSNKERGLVAKGIAKGIALGLVCCSMLFVADFLYASSGAFKPLFSGQPWTYQTISSAFAGIRASAAWLPSPFDRSHAIPSILIMLACGTFGLMNGIRCGQVARLRQEIEAESEKALAATERLRALSLTDPLTGLSNRRRFFDELNSEVKRAERYGQPLTCMMIDLDDFKNVNDSHGHQFGDFVLQQIAQILRRNAANWTSSRATAARNSPLFCPAPSPTTRRFSRNGSERRLRSTVRARRGQRDRDRKHRAGVVGP